MDGETAGEGPVRCYGYAVARADMPLPEGLTGVEDRALERLEVGKLALIVSRVEATTLRPQRKHLSAHYKVLSQLSQGHDTLPMAFGIIFDDADAATVVLRDHGQTLARQLDKVSGSVEMGLRLRWEGVDVFTAVVDSHADLRQMRDRCFSGGNPSQRELLDLGQAFEKRLNEDREKRREVVLATLRPLCSDIKVLPPPNENTSVNVACLVRRSVLGEFDKAVDKLAEVFDDNHVLEVDGPLPAFNFVDIRI